MTCDGLVQSIRFDKRVNIPLKNWVAPRMEPEEVEMLVSPAPRLAPGNRMQEDMSFRVLEKKIQVTQLCEKALNQHPVAAGSYYKIRPDEDDGWRKVTHLCRE